jgi:hypothetical protein
MWNKSKLNYVVCALAASLSLSTAAHAGSHNGNLEGAVGQSGNVNCDNRLSLKDDFKSWCTVEFAKAIQTSCYAVVHSEPIQRCGWQGCGYTSFVGSKPSLSGAHVKEYGLSTPHGMASIPEEWQRSGNTVLPKAPFPRVYLTVDQFVEVKKNCSKNHNFADASSVDRICTTSERVLELNPYYFCLKYQKIVP